MKKRIKLYLTLAITFALFGCNSFSPKTLKTGIYRAEGTFNNRSWRQIARNKDRYCIEIGEGPPSPYAGTIEVHTSSITSKDGKFIIDETKDIVKTTNDELIEADDRGWFWNGESNNYSNDLMDCLTKRYANGECNWVGGTDLSGNEIEFSKKEIAEQLKECRENLNQRIKDFR